MYVVAEGNHELVKQCAGMFPGLTWEPHESAWISERPTAFGYDGEGRRIIVGVATSPTTFSVEISHHYERHVDNNREVYVSTSGGGEGDTLEKAYALARACYVEACEVKRPIFP